MTIDLDSLPEEEKRELFDRLTFYFSTPAKQVSAADQLLWDALNAAVPPSERRSGSPAPFIKQVTRNKYNAMVTELQRLVTLALPGVHRRPVQEEMARLIIQCLASYVEALEVTVTHTTLVRFSQHMRAGLERAFPGYLDSGLLRYAVRIAQEAPKAD